MKDVRSWQSARVLAVRTPAPRPFHGLQLPAFTATADCRPAPLSPRAYHLGPTPESLRHPEAGQFVASLLPLNS